MKKKLKVAAAVVFYDPQDYSAKGKNAIVKWLQTTASDLNRHHKNFGKHFVARYLYVPEKEKNK